MRLRGRVKDVATPTGLHHRKDAWEEQSGNIQEDVVIAGPASSAN